MLTRLQIRSKGEERGAPVWVELQHLHRVAEVEVEDLVGVEDVHLGEGSRLEQVVDGRALRSRAARQVDVPARGVGAAERAALNADAVRVEQRLDFAGRHPP